MSQPLFLEMPVHLLTAILSNLDSMQSLGSAILSHSSLYAAFKEQSTNIIYRIVQNQIPSDIIPYATAVYKASQVDNRNPDDVGRILRRFFFNNVYPSGLVEHLPTDLDPAVAHALSKTHSVIDHFARGFVDDTLPLTRNQLGLYRPNYNQASMTEIFRIHRALYRFQLYCNLRLRDQSDLCRASKHEIALNSQTAFFFQVFSPWVNEQLACIHDYLERELSIGTFPTLAQPGPLCQD